MAGRYSDQEASVHAFDQMVADRYIGELSWTKRIVRERHDVPPPKGDPATPVDSSVNARAKATAGG